MVTTLLYPLQHHCTHLALYETLGEISLVSIYPIINVRDQGHDGEGSSYRLSHLVLFIANLPGEPALNHPQSTTIGSSNSQSPGSVDSES